MPDVTNKSRRATPSPSSRPPGFKVTQDARRRATRPRREVLRQDPAGGPKVAEGHHRSRSSTPTARRRCPTSSATPATLADAQDRGPRLRGRRARAGRPTTAGRGRPGHRPGRSRRADAARGQPGDRSSSPSTPSRPRRRRRPTPTDPTTPPDDAADHAAARHADRRDRRRRPPRRQPRWGRAEVDVEQAVVRRRLDVVLAR